MRIVILGIDGMDNELILKWEEDLPNLSMLRKSMPPVKFRSIFPPDTTPAWATIYTGMSPAEHGIINFVNPADKDGGFAPIKLSDNLLKGKTFWDAASGAGLSVCVVLPMLIYPGWEINGSMMVRSTCPNSFSTPIKAIPNEIIKKYQPSPKILNMVGGFYSKSEHSTLLRLLRERLFEEARITMEMMTNERWSLFFSYLSPLDEVQHVFWHYCDKDHPRYPGSSEFETAIFDFYKETDVFVGKIMSLCRNNDIFIVISDHGHGARPTRIANINEFLRIKGYLHAKNQSSVRAKNKIKFWLKKALLEFVERYGAGKTLMSLSKKFPLWKQLLAPSSGIDWNLTKAYVSDLSAVKNYSYGGIRLNNIKSDFEKTKIIDDILSSITELRIPETGAQLVKFAERRENLYKGKHIDKYPEILLELDESYGIGWGFSGELFESEADMSHLKPGCHRRSSPVFLSRNIDTSLLKEMMDLCDIAPLVKSIFGLNGKER